MADTTNIVKQNGADPAKGSVTIPVGTPLSNEVALAGCYLSAVYVPTGWTAATLSFQASNDDGATYFNVWDKNGEVNLTIAASQVIALDPNVFRSFNRLKLRSGTGGSPVNQTTNDKLLGLICRPNF